jgi:hypothetical protein
LEQKETAQKKKKAVKKSVVKIKKVEDKFYLKTK